MRLFLLLLAFFALAAAECGWVVNPSLPAGLKATDYGARVPVCHAAKTKFSRFIAPLYDLINGLLYRAHEDVEDGDDAAWKHWPWLVMSLPSYANYTRISDDDSPGQWYMHSHGTLYKRTPRDETQLNRTVERFLPLTSLKKHPHWWSPLHHFETLPGSEADQARKITADLAHTAIQNAPMVVDLPQLCLGPQIFHTLTDKTGTVDQWHTLDAACSTAVEGIEISRGIKTANMTIRPYNLPCRRHPQSRDSQKVFFVPPRGLSIVSDVDDVLRVAEVWNLKQTVLDLVARPYTPWLNMDKVYHNWSRDIPLGGGGYWRNQEWIPSPLPTEDTVTNVHFHYVSDTPEPAAGFYINGTNHFYPAGSWDVRPLDTTSIAALTNARIRSIRRVIETFPERKFVLIGDTTSNHMMHGFPKLWEEFPNQVQCILMRDTQATEPADWIIPAMRHFKKLPDNKYLFFRTPAGHKGTTLANVSTHHLASLAALTSPDGLTDDYFPPYVELLTDGCFPMFPLEENIAQSIYPNGGVFTRLRSFFVGLWWKIVCLWVQWVPGHRPDYTCRFDRRPGTKYHNGTVEPQHDQ